MKLLENKIQKENYKTIFIGLPVNESDLINFKGSFAQITEKFYSANILIQGSFKNGLTTALLKLAYEWVPFKKKIKVVDENLNEREEERLFDKIVIYTRWYDFKRNEIDRLLDPFILIIDDWMGEYEEKLWYVLDVREKNHLVTLIGTHALKVDSIIFSKFDCVVKINKFEIKEIRMQWQ